MLILFLLCIVLIILLRIRFVGVVNLPLALEAVALKEVVLPVSGIKRRAVSEEDVARRAQLQINSKPHRRISWRVLRDDRRIGSSRYEMRISWRGQERRDQTHRRPRHCLAIPSHTSPAAMSRSAWSVRWLLSLKLTSAFGSQLWLPGVRKTRPPTY